MNYAEGIRQGFVHLLKHHPRVIAIGQGVWSPWYVGNTMKDLDLMFGRHRVIDTPVSENGVTGAAIGAALFGYRPIVIHPRMDFMILATDAIVNQAAKWHHMLGGNASPAVTFRGIINRGGEQGAQHSQALHAWYAHVPGLRVVMPSCPQDARDLLIASVLSDAPTVYIDDRWLYDVEEAVGDVEEVPLADVGPRVIHQGSDISLVGIGWGVELCRQASRKLADMGVSCEIVDVRVLNPYNGSVVANSVRKTGRLCVVDPGTRTSSFAAEVIASAVEDVHPLDMRSAPSRICLPDAPAPSSRALEQVYYPSSADVVQAALKAVGGRTRG